MNRDFTQDELDCIKNDFSKEEFGELINKITEKKKYNHFKVEKQELLEFLKTLNGVDRLATIEDAYDSVFDTIIYNYKKRKDIKICFHRYEYGMLLKLKIRNYSYTAESFEDLINKIPAIHEAIDNCII